MKDNFDLKKFLKESKAIENLNPSLKNINEKEDKSLKENSLIFPNFLISLSVLSVEPSLPIIHSKFLYFNFSKDLVSFFKYFSLFQLGVRIEINGFFLLGT